MDELTIKLAMGGVATICCALAGRSLASRSTRRAALLAETMDAMQLLRVHMLDNLMPLAAALEKSSGRILRELGHLLGGRDSAEAWREFMKRQLTRGGIIDSLTDADIETLTGFFDRLGSSSVDEQRQLFDGAVRELGVLEADARSEGEKRNRLYMSLGALAGAALVVSLI